MSTKPIFRIIFHHEDQCFELYAEKVYQSDMHGFIVIEDMIFGEQSTILVDPTEEKLKSEFAGVKRTFVPMHEVVRIDQVKQCGTAKIRSAQSDKSNVTTLPGRSQSGQPTSK